MSLFHSTSFKITGTFALIVCALGAAAPLASAQSTNLPPISLTAAKSWAYQIQGLEVPGAIDALAKSSYDLLVLEPTRTDWSHPENKQFDTPAMVHKLQATPAGDGVHRKLVIAYIDIGEAEGYRWYWHWTKGWGKGKPRPADLPAFIVRLDPDGWADNFPVAYWEPAWKDILLQGKETPPDSSRAFRSVLDEVTQSGFDGVYLDWVEAYDERAIKEVAKKEGVDPEAEMIKLIGEIRDYGRQRNPSFLVVQQNAADLLEEHPELLKIVDGIGQEDTWYSGKADAEWDNPKGHDRKISPNGTHSNLKRLHQFLAAGKPVFTVDYTVQDADATYQRALAEGFVPYCSRVSLSRLTTTPPPAKAR
jgi:cysteinyl-tRNA synthetase, unknown class